MKKPILLILILFGVSLFSQKKVSVEKSLFNIQTGFVGLWINNEFRLSDKMVLHSEIGAEPTWYVGSGSVVSLNLRLEPRYYYNLSKKADKDLNISKNSGNFWSVAFNYRPDVVLLSNEDYLCAIESFSIVPKWGIRRKLGKSFNYEAGVGLGFRHEFDYGNYAELDLHLRIGYTF